MIIYISIIHTYIYMYIQLMTHLHEFPFPICDVSSGIIVQFVCGQIIGLAKWFSRNEFTQTFVDVGGT